MSAPALDPRDRAFDRLYRRHARDVYRFVLTVVRNPTEAEDVTQTAFLNAYRAYKRGECPERPQSWLIAIAHNAIRSRHRFRLRRPKEVPFDERLLDLPVAAEERETVAEVLDALGELPVNQRQALAMRELEGRTYPEIAAALGVSVGAVESLIFRARRTLRAKRTSLRGLTVVQLPRSLRTLFQTQPDTVGAGIAANAAVVVAAASVVAGGVLGSGSAGASQHSTALGRHEPSRPLRAVARREPSRVPISLARVAAAPARHAAPKAARPDRPASPPAAPVLPPARGVAAPAVTTSTGAAPAAPEPGSAASPPATAIPAETAVAAAAATIPAVEVPVPSPPPTVTVPPVSSIPTPPTQPELPPVLPTPSVPQVPAPGGIK